MNLHQSLANKIMLTAGSAVTVALLGFVGLSGWSAADRTRADVLALATEQAAHTAA